MREYISDRDLSYFRLFQGEVVPLSTIKKESPGLVHAVEAIAKSESIVGQYVFPYHPKQEIDVLLWMPKQVKENSRSLPWE